MDIVLSERKEKYVSGRITLKTGQYMMMPRFPWGQYLSEKVFLFYEFKASPIWGLFAGSKEMKFQWDLLVAYSVPHFENFVWLKSVWKIKMELMEGFANTNKRKEKKMDETLRVRLEFVVELEWKCLDLVFIRFQVNWLLTSSCNYLEAKVPSRFELRKRKSPEKRQKRD